MSLYQTGCIGSHNRPHKHQRDPGRRRRMRGRDSGKHPPVVSGGDGASRVDRDDDVLHEFGGGGPVWRTSRRVGDLELRLQQRTGRAGVSLLETMFG